MSALVLFVISVAKFAAAVAAFVTSAFASVFK